MTVGRWEKAVSGVWTPLLAVASSPPPVQLDSARSTSGMAATTSTTPVAITGMALGFTPRYADRVVRISFTLPMFMTPDANTTRSFTITVQEQTLGETSPRSEIFTSRINPVASVVSSIVVAAYAEFEFSDLSLYRTFQLQVNVSNAAASVSMLGGTGVWAKCSADEVIVA